MSKHSIQEQTSPRSVLRHRPISPSISTDDTSVMPRASRGGSSRQRGMQPTMPPVALSSLYSHHRGARRRWLLFVGIGMLLALALGVLGHVALTWINVTRDDLHYGRPRTFQVDAFVGHETTGMPSHFIALNLHGRIEILEFPGGDGTHARIFLGPQLYGDDAALVPVTLSFVDSRHNHHPDMVVVFGQGRVVFRNEQGTFRLSQGT